MAPLWNYSWKSIFYHTNYNASKISKLGNTMYELELHTPQCNELELQLEVYFCITHIYNESKISL